MTHAHQNEKENLLVVMKTTKTKRMYECYQTIYFYVQGFSIKDITNMIGRSNLTIGTYIKRYQATEISGLEISYSPGAPSRLTPEQEERIYEVVVHHSPAELGLKSSIIYNVFYTSVAEIRKAGRPVIGGTPPMVKLSTYANKICKMD